MADPDSVRWTIIVSRETDLALRRHLGSLGMKKGDLSRFVEAAVRGRVLDDTVQAIRRDNHDLGQDALEDLLEENLQAVRAERTGLEPKALREMANELKWPESVLLKAIGLSPSSWSQMTSSGSLIDGAPGFAGIALQDLLQRARELVRETVAPERAVGFDTGTWLGRWLQQSMPALGGQAPVDVLAVPTGQKAVMRLLGALESSAYQ